MTPLACVSVDMDGIPCYAAIHGLNSEQPFAPPDPIFATALGRFLDLFRKRSIKATFFCIGQDLENPSNAELFRQAVADGHELANHSYSHLYNLRSQSLSTIRDEIAKTGALIAEIAGAPPVGFRTPGYNISGNIARTLVEQNYLYDSSMFPCPPYYAAKGLVMARIRLEGRQSRSQMTLPQTLLSPMTPYKASPDQPWKRCGHGDGLWEIPMCVVPMLRFPLIGTSLHLVGANGFKMLMPLLTRSHPNVLNLEFHGIDLLDWSDEGVPLKLRDHQPDLAIPLNTKLATYNGIFTALERHYTFQTTKDAVSALQSNGCST